MKEHRETKESKKDRGS